MLESVFKSCNILPFRTQFARVHLGHRLLAYLRAANQCDRDSSLATAYTSGLSFSLAAVIHCDGVSSLAAYPVSPRSRLPPLTSVTETPPSQIPNHPVPLELPAFTTASEPNFFWGSHNPSVFINSLNAIYS